MQFFYFIFYKCGPACQTYPATSVHRNLKQILNSTIILETSSCFTWRKNDLNLCFCGPENWSWVTRGAEQASSKLFHPGMEIGDMTLEWTTYYQPHNLAAADACEIRYKFYDGNIDKENDSACRIGCFRICAVQIVKMMKMISKEFQNLWNMFFWKEHLVEWVRGGPEALQTLLSPPTLVTSCWAGAEPRENTYFLPIFRRRHNSDLNCSLTWFLGRSIPSSLCFHTWVWRIHQSKSEFDACINPNLPITILIFNLHGSSLQLI